MPTIIVLSLSVAFLALSLIAIVIFLRAAFCGEQDLLEADKAALNWRPPFVRGGALRNWAAMTAERLAQDGLRGERTNETVVELAAKLEEGAVHAMLPLARPSELERIVACPETGQGIVGVTAVEALTVAAHLRKSYSRADQERIYEVAVDNSKKIKAAKESIPLLWCPLQGPDQVCCVYAARPLCCRPLHAIAVDKAIGSRSMEAGSHAEAPDDDRHEHAIEQGIEIGLARALNSAGLDANVYELNSALALALEMPYAAERWANGEGVFEGCHCLKQSNSESR